MSNTSFDAPAYPTSLSDPAEPPEPTEFVARGLLSALVAIAGGIVVTVLIWRIGSIASVTGFIVAVGAVYLYSKGAGAQPRKGLVPLITLIVIGVIATFFAVMVSDAWDVYGNAALRGGEGRLGFIEDNIFRGDVVRSHGQDMAMFAVFAVLGIFSPLHRLLHSAH